MHAYIFINLHGYYWMLLYVIIYCYWSLLNSYQSCSTCKLYLNVMFIAAMVKTLIAKLHVRNEWKTFTDRNLTKIIGF